MRLIGFKGREVYEGALSRGIGKQQDHASAGSRRKTSSYSGIIILNRYSLCYMDGIYTVMPVE